MALHSILFSMYNVQEEHRKRAIYQEREIDELWHRNRYGYENL